MQTDQAILQAIRQGGAAEKLAVRSLYERYHFLLKPYAQSPELLGRVMDIFVLGIKDGIYEANMPNENFGSHLAHLLAAVQTPQAANETSRKAIENQLTWQFYFDRFRTLPLVQQQLLLKTYVESVPLAGWQDEAAEVAVEHEEAIQAFQSLL